MPHARCETSSWEPLFVKIVKAIFAGGIVPNGSVVDCGANTGGEACLYADLAPNRLIHAVEPLQGHIDFMQHKYGDRKNIIALHGALGSTEHTVQIALQKGSKMIHGTAMAHSVANGTKQTGTRFRVHRVDTLFGPGGLWATEHLAFGHFDVEGAEADLLRGAIATIRRDRPIFSMETTLQTGQELLNLVADLGYQPHLVPEKCGYNGDCRNVICLPLESIERMLQEVPLLASSTFAVNWTSMALPLAMHRQLARG